MQRSLLYLTLVLTVFTFIAVVLINNGGIDPCSSSCLATEKNTAFNLVNVSSTSPYSKLQATHDDQWNFTLTPQQSYSSYSYHLYLNRMCTGAQSGQYRNIVNRACRNRRTTSMVRDGCRLYAPNSLVQMISPFRFLPVNLNVPFAFYILTAMFAFVLLVVTFIRVGTIGKRG